jgi:hypothetical protein
MYSHILFKNTSKSVLTLVLIHCFFLPSFLTNDWSTARYIVIFVIRKGTKSREMLVYASRAVCRIVSVFTTVTSNTNKHNMLKKAVNCLF